MVLIYPITIYCFYIVLLGCMGVLHYTVMPFPNYAFIHVSRQIRKKAAEEAKRNNLLALLKERKIRRKQSPLCPTPSKRMRAHTLSDSLSEEDDDDGGVVPEKQLVEVRQKELLHLKK